METAFDELTILKYFHVFKEYCKCLSKEPEKLELTGEEFILIPCLAVNPLRNQFLRCIPSKSGAGNHMGNVDFPAFGCPINPTSAIILSSKFKSNVSPFFPAVDFLGV